MFFPFRTCFKLDTKRVGGGSRVLSDLSQATLGFQRNYRRSSCMEWAQLPFGEASGKRGPAHRNP